MSDQINRRVIVIDDTTAIHEDFAKILKREDRADDLGTATAALFPDETAPTVSKPKFDLVFASQGEEGYEQVRSAVAAERRFALAFVDMRMPPGWDGLKTITKLWEADPDLQIVICSAFSDYSWSQIINQFGLVDRLLILKKPFDVSEVCQLACALTEKWQLAKTARLKLGELQTMVEEQTVSLKKEIQDRILAEERLRHDATHDVLTGLSNRAVLTEQLRRCIARSKRDQSLFALLFLDLDRFKIINDSLGHGAGDALLIGIAERLGKCIRGTDTLVRMDSDNLVRLGGDEFVLMLERISAPADAVRVAQRVQDSFLAPFNLEGHEVFTSGSIGIAVGGAAYDTPDQILRDADIALYQSKAAGKGCFHIFQSEMHASAMLRLKLENELRRALERDEFVLHYQPILSLLTGEVCAVEALLRWQHPERGLLLPGEFIAIAEETGLIVPTGTWVLHQACAAIRRLEAQHPWMRAIGIAVNVSGRQFATAGFAAEVEAVLRQTGLPADRLHLEITEGAAIDGPARTLEVLQQLRQMNVQLHLDDFGTGYSSLSYLHRMPLSALKVDRSFIGNMSSDRFSSSIVEIIVSLAHTLKLQVVAEGVETAEQADRLRSAGCDRAQGYYFARPLPASDLGAFIASRRISELALSA